MNSSRAWIISTVLFFFALILVLIQHWGLSFTNADDPSISQLGFQGSIDNAKSQGRFWLVPVLFLAQLPYLMDSWEWVNSIKIIVNGLTFLSFVLFCSKLANKHSGLLMGLVWLALIDISPSNYSPIHGFLLMFNVQFFFLFLSFYLFLEQMEKNDPERIIVIPYFLFAFAILAYEPMFFYSLVFPALYLYKQRQVLHPQAAINLYLHAKKFLAKNFTLLIVLTLYVILFFGFRKIYETSTIRGLDVGDNLLEILKTIYSFSIHGFHFQLKPFNASILELYSTSNLLLAALYAASISMAMFFLIPRINENLTPNALYKKSSLIVLVFFIFSPNILLGLVEGYRKWAAYDPHYVGNYFSSFPLTMAVTLGLLYLVGGDKSKHEKILFALILYLFFSAAFDNYARWGKLAEINRNGNLAWQKAFHQLSQKSFEPQHQSLVCGINAPKQYITGDDKYWSKYLSKKFSSDILYVSNKVSATSCDLILDFQKIQVQ